MHSHVKQLIPQAKCIEWLLHTKYDLLPNLAHQCFSLLRQHLLLEEKLL